MNNKFIVKGNLIIDFTKEKIDKWALKQQLNKYALAKKPRILKAYKKAGYDCDYPFRYINLGMHSHKPFGLDNSKKLGWALRTLLLDSVDDDKKFDALVKIMQNRIKKLEIGSTAFFSMRLFDTVWENIYCETKGKFEDSEFADKIINVAVKVFNKDFKRLKKEKDLEKYFETLFN